MHISAILSSQNTIRIYWRMQWTAFVFLVSSEFSPRMVFILIIGVFIRSHFWIRLFSAPAYSRNRLPGCMWSLPEFLHFSLRRCNALSWYDESAGIIVMSINTELLLQSPNRWNSDSLKLTTLSKRSSIPLSYLLWWFPCDELLYKLTVSALDIALRIV